MRKSQAGRCAATVLIVSLLAACSSASSPPTDIPKVAELDPATGAVNLPFDRYTADVEDGNLFRAAQAAARAICAREAGVEFVAPAYVEQDIYRSESFLGPWTLSQAQKFGFVEPAPDADLRANGYVSADYGEPSRFDYAAVGDANSRLSEDEWAVVDECGAAANEFAPPATGPWFTELDALNRDVLDPGSPEVAPILEDLYACYEERSIGQHPSVAGWPQGADNHVINEEQISLAIASVECKIERGTTQKLADVWAAAQAPILEEYAAEAVETGNRLDAVREDAKEFLAAHPEVTELP